MCGSGPWRFVRIDRPSEVVVIEIDPRHRLLEADQGATRCLGGKGEQSFVALVERTSRGVINGSGFMCYLKQW